MSKDPMQEFIAQLAKDNGQTVEEFKATGLPENVPLIASPEAKSLFEKLDDESKRKLLSIRPDTIEWLV